MTNKEAIFELIKYRRRLEEDHTIIFACGAFDAEPFDMAIEALEEAKKREETWEWCTDCKEYDQENHCCHRFSKRIWESVEELKRDRKHSEWIPVEDSDCWRGFLCSVCNKAVNQRENFCPNCGSRMKRGGR